jgi:hypothetical protein
MKVVESGIPFKTFRLAGKPVVSSVGRLLRCELTDLGVSLL